MIVPQWGAFAGPVDLGDLLFMNPASRQPSHYQRSKIVLAPGTELTRRYWAPAGSYRVAIDGDPAIEVRIDGQATEGDPPRVQLTGMLHRLVISAPHTATLRGLSITRDD